MIRLTKPWRSVLFLFMLMTMFGLISLPLGMSAVLQLFNERPGLFGVDSVRGGMSADVDVDDALDDVPVDARDDVPDDVGDEVPSPFHAKVVLLSNTPATYLQPKRVHHHAVYGIDPKSSVCTQHSTFDAPLSLEARVCHQSAPHVRQLTTSTMC